MKKRTFFQAAFTVISAALFIGCSDSAVPQTPDMVFADVIGPVKSVSTKMYYSEEDFEYDKDSGYESEHYEFDEQGRFTKFKDIKLKYNDEGKIKSAYSQNEGSKERYHFTVKRNEKGFISKYFSEEDEETGIRTTFTYKYSFYDNGTLKRKEESMDGYVSSMDVTMYDEAGHVSKTDDVNNCTKSTYEIVKTDDHGNWIEAHVVGVNSYGRMFVPEGEEPDEQYADDTIYSVVTRKIKYYE